MMDLSACQTNSDVVEIIKSKVQSFDVNDLIKDCSKDFIYHENAVRALYCALASGENIILYGPGGFGKSVLVKALLKRLEIPYAVKVGYEGMQPEELFGIPNMDKLMKESEYEIAFEKSVFAEPGVLVLEEFLDAHPSTGAALKDIISEKGFRDKTSFKHSMISSVIICSNKSPDDISSNDSLAAFYKERFPIRFNMKWISYDAMSYELFFRVYFKEKYDNYKPEFSILANICAYSSSGGEIISPRVASQAGNIMLHTGLENINVVTGLSTVHLDELIQGQQQEDKNLIQKQILSQVGMEVDTATFITSDLIKLLKYQEILEKLNFEDKYTFLLETVIQKINKFKIEFYEKNMLQGLKDRLNKFEELCLPLEE